MTSSIITSLSILNIWRRGRLTALDDDVVDDDGDDDDDDDNSDDGSDVDLGVRFFTKIQDQIKNPDHQDFSLRKETIIVKCLEGFSWREEKRKKKTEEKITEVFSVIQVCAHSDPPYPFSALALQYWIVNYLTCLKKVVFVTERSYSFETENEPVTVLL